MQFYLVVIPALYCRRSLPPKLPVFIIVVHNKSSNHSSLDRSPLLINNRFEMFDTSTGAHSSSTRRAIHVIGIFFRRRTACVSLLLGGARFSLRRVLSTHHGRPTPCFYIQRLFFLTISSSSSSFYVISRVCGKMQFYHHSS